GVGGQSRAERVDDRVFVLRSEGARVGQDVRVAGVGGRPVVSAGRVDGDGGRGGVVLAVGAVVDGRRRGAEQLAGHAVVAGVVRGRVGPVELEGDRAGRVRGATGQGRLVGQADRAVRPDREGAAGVGGQAGLERVDDRVFVL